MGFATEWLAERAIFPAVIKETPDYKTGIVVVVPAFNEPDITVLLDSLSECSEPECKVEIIVVINAREDSGEDLIQNNKICIENIERWKNYEYILDNFQIYVYPRPGHGGSKFLSHPHVKLVPAPLIEISSTMIRDSINSNKRVSYFLPPKVEQYIEDMGVYKFSKK